MKMMNCEQCEARLFEFHEGKLDQEMSGKINQHVSECDECAALLNDIWQMSLAASRWQPHNVPRWEPAGSAFESRQRQWPQMLATAASIMALVMVLTDTRIVNTEGGFTVASGGRHTVSTQQFEAFALDQTEKLNQLASQQVASDQLVLRSMLEASREERRDDMTTLANFLNTNLARHSQQTDDNLRYLLASQAEDERDIQQLSQVVQQTLTRGNDM